MGTPVGKDEFLSKNTSGSLLNQGISNNPGQSTDPVRLKSFSSTSGKMFTNTNQAGFKTPDARAK